MLFSSLTFLYIFLPIVIIGNFLIKDKFKNRLLLIASLIFFAWGGVSYSILLIASLIINYFAGLGIDKFKGESKSKIILAIGILLNLLMLGVFKYANFVVENINYLYLIFDWEPIRNPGIILPLGISFYTFQAMSYIIDIYRNESKVQKNFFKLALYIAFFPQLIAGPIVRYQLIAEQLTNRKHHYSNLSAGIQRFILGLTRKVLFANQFGLVADEVFSLSNSDLTTSTAWIGIICYTLQIYFDFSGYSDMAIGLGRMFGFKLPENFNFPYTSKSIREFWTRWHMTLSDWFRSYLYIPLGGNRISKSRTIINLLIVFFATSVWHGASWNFVFWGMTHGIIMMIERLGLEKLIKKLWKPIQHVYTLFIIVVTWLFFRVEDLSQAWLFLNKMFSFSNLQIDESIASTVNNRFFIIVAILGIISSTTIIIKLRRFFENQYHKLPSGYFKSSLSYLKEFALISIVILGIFICTMLMIGDTYNPFIYFRF